MKDGETRVPKPKDIQPGVILRMVCEDGAQSAFSDCVVLRVEQGRFEGFEPTYNVLLGRPYAYGSSLGTTSPTVLTGVERFSVALHRICNDDMFRLVLLSTGEPQKFST